jgi:Cytochrome P450
VAGEDEQHQLVVDIVVRERLARERIGCGDQCTHQRCLTGGVGSHRGEDLGGQLMQSRIGLAGAPLAGSGQPLRHGSAAGLWALGHHPAIQDRVFDEVSALGDRPLTPDDVPRLGHTVRVLHEALRLCPPGAGTPRLLKKDLAVDGYRLGAGTVAVVSFYAMHRDPKLWSDPLKFDPDRFLPERSQGRSRWQYLPFAGRTSVLYRRSLRHAGGHPRAGHPHPRGPDRIAG